MSAIRSSMQGSKDSLSVSRHFIHDVGTVFLLSDAPTYNAHVVEWTGCHHQNYRCACHATSSAWPTEDLPFQSRAITIRIKTKFNTKLRSLYDVQLLIIY